MKKLYKGNMIFCSNKNILLIVNSNHKTFQKKKKGVRMMGQFVRQAPEPNVLSKQPQKIQRLFLLFLYDLFGENRGVELTTHYLVMNTAVLT